MTRQKKKFPCPACGGTGMVSDRIYKRVTERLKPRIEDPGSKGPETAENRGVRTTGRWIMCREMYPSDAGHDVVLVLIKDWIKGEFMLPQVARYDEAGDYWENQLLGKIYTGPEEMWSVVAWAPIPEGWREA